MTDRRRHEDVFVTENGHVELSWSSTFQLPPMLRFWHPRTVDIHMRGNRLTGLEITMSPAELNQVATHWLVNGPEAQS